MELVTLDDAKAHLKVFDTVHDAELSRALADATAFVVAYLNLADDPGWTVDTVPGPVRAGVLVYLTLHWVHRDDWTKDQIEAGTHEGLANLLRAFRVPAIG